MDVGRPTTRYGHWHPSQRGHECVPTGPPLGKQGSHRVGAFHFWQAVTDVLSGYRVLSRRFVKSFPALATGFETETEFTVHALELGMPIAEISTKYRSRLIGSVSKLRTFSDGLRILAMIVRLIKEERPLHFFSIAGLGLLARPIHRIEVDGAV
jgi:hypothetical protein